MHLGTTTAAHGATERGCGEAQPQHARKGRISAITLALASYVAALRGGVEMRPGPGTLHFPIEKRFICPQV